MKHPRASKRRLCNLFGHRPFGQEFVGSDITGPTISVVTMKTCWCKRVITMESTIHLLALPV